MSNYLLFQIIMTSEKTNSINREGWDCARMIFPRVHAYLANYMAFNVERRVSDLNNYTMVARVKAQSLDEVFELTNLWNDPNKVKKFRKSVRSGSVGDIIADIINDRFYMIASSGFDDITDHIIQYPYIILKE